MTIQNGLDTTLYYELFSLNINGEEIPDNFGCNSIGSQVLGAMKSFFPAKKNAILDFDGEISPGSNIYASLLFLGGTVVPILIDRDNLEIYQKSSSVPYEYRACSVNFLSRFSDRFLKSVLYLKIHKLMKLKGCNFLILYQNNRNFGKGWAQMRASSYAELAERKGSKGKLRVEHILPIDECEELGFLDYFKKVFSSKKMGLIRRLAPI